MKNILRNFALGTALAVSFSAFAEDYAEPVITTIFERTVVTDANTLGTVNNDTRSAVGYKGAIYALNKGKGTIFKIDGTGVTAFRTGIKTSSLSPAITCDDAGNFLVCYGWSGTLNGFGIIPANGGDIIYQDATFTSGWTSGRVDGLGRVVGDMLSDEGAYLYLAGASSGTSVGCYKIKNGVITPIGASASYKVSSSYPAGQSNLNTGTPAYSTMEEMAAVDPIANGGFLIQGMQGGRFYYLDNFTTTAKLAPNPSGISYYPSNIGGDTFVYDGVRYYARPYSSDGEKIRTGNFVVYNEKGTVIFNPTFSQNFSSDGALNGGSLQIRKVGQKTFEIGFFGGTSGKAHAACYTICFGPEDNPDEPEPVLRKLYYVGAATGWAEPSEANAATYANYALTETAEGSNIYTGTIHLPNLAENYFRFFAGLDGWGSTSYGPSAENGNFAITFTDGTYEAPIYTTNEGNYNVSALPVNGSGDYDFTIDLNDNTIKIGYTFSYTPPTFYINGSWGSRVKMDAVETDDAENPYIYTYTASLENVKGTFNIESADASIKYGCEYAFENGVARDIWSDNANAMTLPDGKYITLHFVYNPVGVISQLTVDWLESADLSRFAYDISYKQIYNAAAGKHYGVVTYKASGAGAHAYLIATPVASTYALTAADDAPAGQIIVDMGEAQAGENTYELDLDQFSYEQKYNFAIQLENNHEGLGTPKVVWKEQNKPSFGGARGGVVAITDPEYDSYGYVLMALARAQGVQIYKPDGTLLGTYTYSAFDYGTDGNAVPLRGDQRFGNAVFVSWGDANSGLYMIDPLDPTADAVQLAQGNRASNGTFTYNGHTTISGSSGVAFSGKGEDTMLWMFDEDIFVNKIAAYPVGNDEFIGTPSSEAIIQNGSNGTWNALLNKSAVNFEPASNGVFVAQYRANGMDTSYYSFVYLSQEGKLIADSYHLLKACGYNLASSVGAVALSPDESILAVLTYTGVEFFSVEWNNNVPALTHLYGVDMKYGMNMAFCQAKFDPANNLYLTGASASNTSATQFRACITLPGTVKAATPAKALEQNLIVSGVENVSADAAVEYEPVYYTLGGVKVAADQLTPGIYVKVVGPTATKVVVK